MKFDLDNSNARHSIQSITEDALVINGERFGHSVVLAESMPIQAWQVDKVAALDQQQIAWLATLDCEVLLIGTGTRLRFPDRHLLEPLYQARVGFEIMDTAAACRSYVILAAEGRRVCAALILERGREEANQ